MSNKIMLRNGVSLDDAIRAFRAKKTATKKKLNKYAYHSIGEYTALLDSCFGLTGYVVHYSDGRAFALSSGQDILMVKATIDILDENGAVVYQMEGYGSYEPITETEGTKHLNLQNAGVIVDGYGLKAACTSAGAFGMRPCLPKEDAEGMLYASDEDETSVRPVVTGSVKTNVQGGNTPVAKPVQNRNQSKPAAGKKEPSVFKIKTRGTVVEAGQDKDGNTIYAVEYLTENGGVGSLIFYDNHYRAEAATFNKFRNRCMTGSVPVTIKGYSVKEPREGYAEAITFVSFDYSSDKK